jgi:MFS family permease
VHLRQRSLFYGWVVLGIAFLIVAVGMGMVFAFSVFFIPLQEEFGWTRAEVAFTSLLNWLAFGLFSLLFGMLSDQIGIQKVVGIGGVILGIGMLLASRVASLWDLYCSFGLLGGMGMGAFYVPLNTMAANWFTKYRGLALAVVSSGIGVGILLMAPWARYWIQVADWRMALLIFAVMAWGIILPLSVFIWNTPADIGQYPYGVFAAETVSPLFRTEWKSDPLFTSKSEVFQQPTFWIIMFTHFFCCIAHSGPIFHMVAYTIGCGISPLRAASVFGMSGAASIIGRLGTGVVADHYGAKRTLVVGLTLQAITILFYTVASSFWSLLLLALLFGPAYGGVMPLYPLLTRQYFGEKGMGTVFGGIFFLSAVGMGLGAYLGGYIFDWTGGYTMLYLKSTVLGSLALLLVIVLRPPGQPQPGGHFSTGRAD